MQGHFLFDEELIADCIAYYRDLDGRELTPEEAGRYLDTLADWYDWLTDQNQRPFPPPLLALSRRDAEPVQRRGMGSDPPAEGAAAEGGAPEPSPLL